MAKYNHRTTAVPDSMPSPLLDPDAAAVELDLTAPAVEALAAAGYLGATAYKDGRPYFALSDLKAFGARNADNGAGNGLMAEAIGPPPALEPDELVALLDSRADEMAQRMMRLFEAVFPWAGSISERSRSRLIEDAKGRFQAILAIAAFGSPVDDDLYRDLYSIGRSAAETQADLPQLLVALRISRDLVVQNAVDLAENGERPGGFALSLVLTRILPTMDSLADALAAGYWENISAS